MLDSSAFRYVVSKALADIAGVTVAPYGDLYNIRGFIDRFCKTGESPAVAVILIENITATALNHRIRQINAGIKIQTYIKITCDDDLEIAWKLIDEIINALLTSIKPTCTESVHDDTIHFNSDIMMSVSEPVQLTDSDYGPLYYQFDFNFELQTYMR